MAKKTKKKETKISVFLKRLTGVLLILAATAFYLALATYHPSDPNLNNLKEGEVQNLLGLFGADISHISIYFLGLAPAVFVLAFFVWGYKLIRYKTILLLKWRIFAFISGIFALSPLFSMVSKACTKCDFLKFNLGGILGQKILALSGSFLSKGRIEAYREPISATVFALIFIVSFNLAMGITFKDWYNFIKKIAQKIYIALAYTWLGIYKLYCLVRGKKPAKTSKIKIEPKLNAKPKAEKAKAKAGSGKNTPSFGTKDYQFPSIDLLSRPKEKSTNEVSQKDLDATAHSLESVLQEFGVNGEIVAVRPGPVVTLYEFKPIAGTKTARVIGLADDIARSMCALSVRIAVVPGTDTIGIEIPNKKRETVWFRDLIEDETFKNSKNTLNVALGKDIGGQNVYADLAKMPHLLVAGTTGSGKSVGVNSMILSLLYKMTPEECKMIMIDPKMLEFSMYNDIPHLLTPVITDPAKAVVGLKWAVCEMEKRYRKISDLHVRNIFGYNQKLKELKESGEKVMKTIQVGFDPETGKPIYEQQELDTTPMPYIVIVVDEVADLMIMAKKEVEAAIQRLAQKARAAGIHLIMATQRPSVDVITGVIKANFPSRISFQVTSKFDSMTILGEKGAEQLLGMGDMLFMSAGLKPQRVHGSFVKDSEVEAIAEFLKTQGAPEYIDEITEGELDTKDAGPVFDNTSMSGSDADLYRQAVEIVRNDKKASTSYIQRRLRIGYNRAAALIDRMQDEGIVGPADHVGRREVIG